jgi:hypothetical protein
MKRRPRFIMSLTVIVILTIVSTSYGQDAYEEPSLIEAEAFRIDGDRILSTPGDTDYRYTITKPVPKTVVKDSSTVATSPAPVNNAAKLKVEKQLPTHKPTVQKQSKEEDESIMSFHFLYYMIQKYKLQDIVE